LKYSLSIPVVNKAIAGRSARSYTVEGHFSEIEKLLKSGDYVVIEFGHNDGGSLSSTDNGRTDCPGDGDEVCNTSVQKGILTFPAYITNAVKSFTGAGATVVVSSQTPDNPYMSGAFEYAPNRFTTYANQSVASSAHAKFVDHGQLVANAFEKLGKTQVDGFYPKDHTHTSPEGADVVAKAFVRGLVCSQSTLKSHVKNATSSIQGGCL